MKSEQTSRGNRMNRQRGRGAPGSQVHEPAGQRPSQGCWPGGVLGRKLGEVQDQRGLVRRTDGRAKICWKEAQLCCCGPGQTGLKLGEDWMRQERKETCEGAYRGRRAEFSALHIK